jgi:hypothetical protein
MPEEIVKIFEDIGFKWGGRWAGAFRDPMHFQLEANPFNSTGRLTSANAKKYADLIYGPEAKAQAPAGAPGTADKGGKTAPVAAVSRDVAHNSTKNIQKIANDHATNSANLQINPEKIKMAESLKKQLYPISRNISRLRKPPEFPGS